MMNIFERIIGKAAIEKERELARRLEASGTNTVEVVGRGAIITSKEDLASSDTVKLMKIKARRMVSEQVKQEEKMAKGN